MNLQTLALLAKNEKWKLPHSTKVAVCVASLLVTSFATVVVGQLAVHDPGVRGVSVDAGQPLDSVKGTSAYDYLTDGQNRFVEIDTVNGANGTGTGLGPFLSILRTGDPWEKFERIVLVHAVRYSRDLSYADTIARISAQRAGRFSFVPFVSRESHRGALRGRIPEAIGDGRLEAQAGVPLTAENAHAMLCGNPDMVRDRQGVLELRGMKRHRRREPGHYTVETYW